MNSECDCIRYVEDRTLAPTRASAPSGPSLATSSGASGPAPSGAVTQTTTLTPVVICAIAGENGLFSAYCVHDCDPLDPADDIIIEGG